VILFALFLRSVFFTDTIVASSAPLLVIHGLGSVEYRTCALLNGFRFQGRGVRAACARPRTPPFFRRAQRKKEFLLLALHVLTDDGDRNKLKANSDGETHAVSTRSTPGHFVDDIL